MRPWVLKEMNLDAVRQQRYEVAVLPIGAIEPHNLHIPYGCDWFHGEALAERCCQHAHQRGGRVICLPPIPYGTDSNLLAFPLAMNLYPSTLAAVIKDIVHSLEHSGVPKLVLFNSHGGNSFKGVLRELQPDCPVFCSLVEWWKTVDDVIAEVCEGDPGEHGGEMETSIALALFGELVFMDQADDGRTKPSRLEGLNKGIASITRPWHLLTTNAGVGDPRKATAEKGERLITAVVDRIGGYLLELARTPVDDTFPY